MYIYVYNFIIFCAILENNQDVVILYKEFIKKCFRESAVQKDLCSMTLHAHTRNALLFLMNIKPQKVHIAKIR